MLIKGKSIYLRAVRARDLDAFIDLISDVESGGPWFPIIAPSESDFKREFQETGFWREDRGRIFICDFEDNLLGAIFYFKATPYYDGYELGYRLFRPQDSGKRGVMTEAVILATYMLFAMRKINRIELKIFPANTASKRVAIKSGYTLEGLARQAVYMRGKYEDLEIYSILREEAPATYEEVLARLEGHKKSGK